MAQPYIGEIRMFAGNFPPKDWMFCEGQPLSISEHSWLFQLIGTTYGGDGETTFNLPNLASRIPLHMGTGPDGTTYQIGEMAGTEEVTLTTQQIPNHSHPMVCSADTATTSDPRNAVLAASTDTNVLGYSSDTPWTPLNASAVAPIGGSQPHENTQPFLCINFIISLFGVYPSQT